MEESLKQDKAKRSSESLVDIENPVTSSAREKLPPLPLDEPPKRPSLQFSNPPLPLGPPPSSAAAEAQFSDHQNKSTNLQQVEKAFREQPDTAFPLETIRTKNRSFQSRNSASTLLNVHDAKEKPKYDKTKGLASYDPRGAAKACRVTIETLTSTSFTPTNLEVNSSGTRKRKLPGDLGLSSFHRRTVDAYEITQQVGAGTFGEVYKARDRVSGRTVALKKTYVHNEKEGFPLTALREIKILQNLKHVNVVELIDIVPSKASPKDSDLGTVFLVFEYLDNDLTGLLENPNIKLTEAHVKCYMKQLLEGLHYIHTNNVIHRDIKAANLLISNNGYLKIGDWGLSRSWVPGGVYTTRVVTLWYRAPELLLGNRAYTPAIDMWAVGCIFAELLSKKSILPGKDELTQIKLILQLCGTPKEEEYPQFFESEVIRNTKFDIYERSMEKRFSWMPNTALDLLQGLLTLNPNKRITAAEALDHDYFWQGSIPCKPEQLPRLGGEGLHEFELKTNLHKQRNKSWQRPMNKRAYNNGHLGQQHY